MRGQPVNHESNAPTFESLEYRILMSATALDPEPPAYESTPTTREAIAIETIEIAHEGLAYHSGGGGETEADAEPQDAFMYFTARSRVTEGNSTGVATIGYDDVAMKWGMGQSTDASLEYPNLTFHLPESSDGETQETKHPASIKYPDVTFTFSTADTDDADVPSAEQLLQSETAASDEGSREFFDATIASFDWPA